MNPNNDSKFWLNQLYTLGEKNTQKGGRYEGYDLDNCVQETAKSMASVETCYGYVMGKLSALAAQNPNEKAISQIKGSEVMEFCQKVRDNQNLSFYQNLCAKKSDAYASTFSS